MGNRRAASVYGWINKAWSLRVPAQQQFSWTLAPRVPLGSVWTIFVLLWLADSVARGGLGWWKAEAMSVRVSLLASTWPSGAGREPPLTVS